MRHVSRALTPHDRRRVGVGGRHRRHDRGIGDAQPLESVHAQLRIDHRHRVVSHLAGGGRVIARAAALAGKNTAAADRSALQVRAELGLDEALQIRGSPISAGTA